MASPFSANKANNWTVNLSDETLVTVEYVKLDASGTTSTTAPPATDQPAKPVDAALLQAREMGARMKEYLTNNGAKENLVICKNRFCIKFKVSKTYTTTNKSFSADHAVI